MTQSDEPADTAVWLETFARGDVYGPRHVLNSLTSLVGWLKKRGFTLSGRRCLDLGCGAHQPLAVASLLYVNGARAVVANDIVPAADPARSARLLHDLLCHAIRSPAHFHVGDVAVDEYRRRLAAFDLEALAAGDLSGGCARTPIRHVVTSVFALQESVGRFDLVSSRAVLEHFLDFDAVCRVLFELTAAGGVGCHLYDFCDHRHYRSPRYHPWSFLAEAEDWAADVPAADVSNRLRLSHVASALERAGFAVDAVWCQRQPVPPEVRAGIGPPFNHLSEDDLSVLRAMLVLERPVSADPREAGEASVR